MKTDSPWLHRYALFVALVALVVIAMGAVVTSLERPIAATPSAAIDPAFELWHRTAGGVVLILMLGLALGFRRQVGWIALFTGIVDAGLGFTGQAFASILHALLAQIFFGCIVAIAVMTSESWKRGSVPDRGHMASLHAFAGRARPVDHSAADYARRSLPLPRARRHLAHPERHDRPAPHPDRRRFPDSPVSPAPDARPAAIALAVITSIQVMLGFTTFMMLILFPETSLAVVITSVLHVATGALTFGAGLALAILIRYNIGRGHSPVSDRM